jgi:hypothetical protein
LGAVVEDLKKECREFTTVRHSRVIDIDAHTYIVGVQH